MCNVKFKELIKCSGSVSDSQLQERNPGQQQEPSRHNREVRPDQITEPSEERHKGRAPKVDRERVGEWAKQSMQEMHLWATELENKPDRNSHHYLEIRKKKHAGLESAGIYKHWGENTAKKKWLVPQKAATYAVERQAEDGVTTVCSTK